MTLSPPQEGRAFTLYFFSSAPFFFFPSLHESSTVRRPGFFLEDCPGYLFVNIPKDLEFLPFLSIRIPPPAPPFSLGGLVPGLGPARFSSFLNPKVLFVGGE